MLNEDIIEFISVLDSSRPKTIEGHHPSLEEWKSWYKGDTDDHVITTIVEGRKVNRKMLSSGLAKLICEEWASCFLNEDTKIRVVDDEDELFQSILEENGFKSKLNLFAEKYFALGLGAIVVMPKEFPYQENEDGNIRIIQSNDNGVKIALLDATRVIPITIEDNDVTEIAVVKYATNKCTIQLHIKNEQGYYVVAEIDGIGNKAGYKFDYTKCRLWETDTKEPLFQCWHPMINDNKYLENNQGTSCFADATDELYTFDMIFDKFNTEFKNGGKKRFISSKLTFINEHGESSVVPLGEEDVYIPNDDVNSPMIQEHSSDLRTEAFIRALQFYANLIARKCGLNEDAIQIDGVSNGGRPMQTATGMILKEQKAKRSIRKQENLATINLKKMAMAIKYIYNTFVADTFTFELTDVSVSFDDNVIEDTTSMKEAELKEVQAGVRTFAEYRAKWFDQTNEDAESVIKSNGMLLNTYLPALQVRAISPALFVDLVFGDSVDNKDELIEFIESNLSSNTIDMFRNDDYMQSTDVEEEETEEEE